MTNTKTVRCTSCREEFTDAELYAQPDCQGCCPKCGTTSVPMDIKQDVAIQINWHELRILTFWAERYAQGLPENHRKSLSTIIDNLQKQKPDLSPLTMVGTVQKLQEKYPGAEIYLEKL